MSDNPLAVFLDVEGQSIPQALTGGPLFEVDMCNWGQGEGPTLLLNAPPFFVCGEAGKGKTTYDGPGILAVPLQEILEKYLLEGCQMDGFAESDAFAKWLREYADRLELASSACAIEPTD